MYHIKHAPFVTLMEYSLESPPVEEEEDKSKLEPSFNSSSYVTK
jgi:hypothetical protein